MSGILPYQVIYRRILKEKLIENADPECIGPHSYDLRVGSYFDPDLNGSINLQEGEGIGVPPFAKVHVGTIEVVHIPRTLKGQLELRSTYIRGGMLPVAQGKVDAGYEGTLNIVMWNFTSETIHFYYGDRICHLEFTELSEPVELGYEYGGQCRQSQYQQSRGATPSRGVTRTKRIGGTIVKELGSFLSSSKSLIAEIVIEVIKNSNGRL